MIDTKTVDAYYPTHARADRIALTGVMGIGELPSPKDYTPRRKAHREQSYGFNIQESARYKIRMPERVPSSTRRHNRKTRRNPHLLKRVEVKARVTELMTNDSGFNKTVASLFALKNKEESRDIGIRKPTRYCFDTTLNLIIDARLSMKHNLKAPSVGTDSDGSIHVQWINKDRELTLVVPARASNAIYVYHEEQDKYAVDENVTAHGLKTWIEWLVNNDKA